MATLVQPRRILSNLPCMAGPADNRSVIEFRQVGFRLQNGNHLVSDLTLQVCRGETLVLLGRSGSGKTTTVKLINRLLAPSSGEVRVSGSST
ncbi:MAG TPA: ATP-binding cassette domain-containing protein, partial [Terriglobales bacterium]